MSVVGNMVCPDCARLNGHTHAAGCPRDMHDVPAAYAAGWTAARFAFGDMARWAKEDAESVIAKNLRYLADEIERHHSRIPKTDDGSA